MCTLDLATRVGSDQLYLVEEKGEVTTGDTLQG